MGRRGLGWLGLALAVGTSTAHAEAILDSLSGFRGWSEPAVRDWRQTNAEVASGAMDHGQMGHGGMDQGSLPTPPDQAAPEPQDTEVSRPMDHQGMNHGSVPTEQADKPAPEPAPSSVPNPASAPPAEAPAVPDRGATPHGSHHP